MTSINLSSRLINQEVMTSYELVYDKPSTEMASGIGNGECPNGENHLNTNVKRVSLTLKTLCRILKAKESIFKYGMFVPRSDNEADASPEHVQ